MGLHWALGREQHANYNILSSEKKTQSPHRPENQTRKSAQQLYPPTPQQTMGKSKGDTLCLAATLFKRNWPKNGNEKVGLKLSTSGRQFFVPGDFEGNSS